MLEKLAKWIQKEGKFYSLKILVWITLFSLAFFAALFLVFGLFSNDIPEAMRFYVAAMKMLLGFCAFGSVGTWLVSLIGKAILKKDVKHPMGIFFGVIIGCVILLSYISKPPSKVYFIEYDDQHVYHRSYCPVLEHAFAPRVENRNLIEWEDEMDPCSICRPHEEIYFDVFKFLWEKTF